MSTPATLSPSYRPDIDGLRALAVLAVVFFHAGMPGFQGGYIGVDVFFVISGYLITRLMRMYFAIRFACRPLPGVVNRTNSASRQRLCEAFNNAVVGAIERLNPRLVILNANWRDKDEDLAPVGDVAPPSGTSNFRFVLEQAARRE